MPDFALEIETGRAYGAAPLIVGLDEAGRGPWAGPVVAAAVWLDPARMRPRLSRDLNDSKAVNTALRTSLFDEIMDCAEAGTAAVGLADATVEEIDAINILQASLSAMTRAAARLAEVLGRMPDAALIDGPHAPRLACPARPVVGGDGLSLSIAAASIVAKVSRDRIMSDLAARHPGYGWERNKGYGTAEHRRALHALGVTVQHRRSFRPVGAVLATNRHAGSRVSDYPASSRGDGPEDPG